MLELAAHSTVIGGGTNRNHYTFPEMTNEAKFHNETWPFFLGNYQPFGRYPRFSMIPVKTGANAQSANSQLWQLRQMLGYGDSQLECDEAFLRPAEGIGRQHLLPLVLRVFPHVPA